MPGSAVHKALLAGLLLICCLPIVSAPMALTAGLVFGLVIGNPWKTTTSTWSRRLLQASVVGSSTNHVGSG